MQNIVHGKMLHNPKKKKHFSTEREVQKDGGQGFICAVHVSTSLHKQD